MNELDFAQDTVSRMKGLYVLVREHEVIRRTVASRVYYSVHHLSRFLLRKVGLRPERWRGSVHKRVIDEVEKRFVETDLMDIGIFQFIEIMRRYRVKADYQLHLTVSENDVENMFEMFDAYLNECKGVLEVIE